jgi:hypothetical protein
VAVLYNVSFVFKLVEQDSFQKKTVCAYAFNRCGLIPRSLLCNGDSLSESVIPACFSGNPGETLTGLPIETFGGDDFRGMVCDTQQLLLRVVHSDGAFTKFHTSPLVNLVQSALAEVALRQSNSLWHQLSKC